jgi:hypothetical protein
MPRAGSGWYYNLTNDLMLAGGAQDARLVRQRYHLHNILTEINCNIGALTPRRLTAVLLPALLGNTFVVKAHAGPTPYALRLVRLNLLRVAYIYRDPRDAMLSAYENGQKALERGKPNAFSHLTDLDKSLEFILEYCRIWQGWTACPQVLHTRFETFLGDYEGEANRLVAFLKLDVHNSSIQSVVDKYRPESARGAEQKGLHFRQGKTGRFRQKYTAEEQEKMNERLGEYLEKMGYPY